MAGLAVTGTRMAMVKALAMPAVLGGSTIGMIASQVVTNQKQIEAQQEVIEHQRKINEDNKIAVDVVSATSKENRQWILVGGAVAVLVVVAGVAVYRRLSRDISDEIIELNKKIERIEKLENSEVLVERLKKRRTYLISRA